MTYIDVKNYRCKEYGIGRLYNIIFLPVFVHSLSVSSKKYGISQLYNIVKLSRIYCNIIFYLHHIKKDGLIP
jgi:hypothetical protein